jgi:hypothetical protein
MGTISCLLFVKHRTGVVSDPGQDNFLVENGPVADIFLSLRERA